MKQSSAVQSLMDQEAEERMSRRIVLSFEGVAQELNNGHVAVWTDGVAIDSDGERFGAYRFVPGVKYRVIVEIL